MTRQQCLALLGGVLGAALHAQGIPATGTGSSAPVSIGTFSTAAASTGEGYWSIDTNGNLIWDGASVANYRFWSMGRANEVAVFGDWNGDGRTKIGVYADGYWLLDYDGNGLYDAAIDKQVFLGGAG